ncbi:hypothetical protein [Methylobacillus sp.]|uniref:hypothetical protein n=1 Tax=Methylobacillus sp. TaxID=56818 RepID=UPI0012CE99FD|nr:hypothetical protein [Methylobacillus sp.]MPS49237.1 hypothetical protein [Methylobacillus sp.]
MELLNSSWLIRMIEKAGPRPIDKLLSVYTLLETWLHAPGIRQGVNEEYSNNSLMFQSCPALTSYLVSLAIAAKLKNPATVVTQMMILLQGAIAEELRNPEMGALLAAQQAAKVVVKDATPSIMVRADEAIRASGYAATFLACTILAVHFLPSKNSAPVHNAQQDVGYQQVTLLSSIDPELLLKAFALRKSMEAGTCPTPNFFSMPKEQISVYMDIVHARLSNNPDIDNRRLSTFLAWYDQQRAWECYPKSQIKQRFISRIGV